MKRSAAFVLACSLAGCGGSGDVVSPPAPTDEAVAFQGDAAHSGVSGVVAPSFPASQAWSKTFAANLSYPLVAGGKVFVVEQPDGTSGAKLHALSTATGALVWGPVTVSMSNVSAAPAYEGGKVFVSTFDGLVLSFDAATGQSGWSAKLPGSYGFVTPPTANAGVVYVGDGGTNRVVALDGSTGAIRWTAIVSGGGLSTPSIADGAVVIAYPCQYHGLVANTGAERWHYNGPCSGGGGATVPISLGAAYVRDLDFTMGGAPLIEVRDVATGTVRGRYAPPGIFFQVPIPAVTPGAAYLLEGSTLRRFDPSLSHATWSFAGDGTLTMPPIVVDTAIVVAGTSGMVYAVDAVTGAPRWSTRLPSTIEDGNDTLKPAPTGLAAGEGHLVVPARNTLTAFRLVP